MIPQRSAATSTVAALPEPRRNTTVMTTTASGTAPLTGEERERLAELLGEVQPASTRLVMDAGAAVRDVRDHEHPKGEDLFCSNLVAWIGERAAHMLRRLVDLEEENARLRGEHADLTPITVHWDREVWPPTGEDTDTIVCCKTDSGHPVALFLDDELREALGLQLVDPDPDSEQPATETPFFQRDHIYTNGTGFTAPEDTTLFLVEHVTRHPERGHLRAIGWIRGGAPGATSHGFFRDEDEFHGWTDITDEYEAAEEQRQQTASEPKGGQD